MQDLDAAIAQSVARAQRHLAFSATKLDRLRLLDGRASEDDELEVLDGFAMRFARAADIVAAQFLRRRVLAGDPGFRGTMIDVLNEAEIDLLVISATLDLSSKLDVLVALQYRLGERRIDLTLRRPEAAAADPFVQHVLPSAVRL